MSITNRYIGLMLLVSCCSATVAFGQRTTIPESLARAGTSLTGGTTIPSGPSPTVSHILADVDVVVRGIVGEGRSYLSNNEKDVFTDHRIESPVLLYQRAVATSKVLGSDSALIVTVLGGQISLSGLTYTLKVAALPPLQPGNECLFLLKRVGDRYFIAGDFYGVFGIANGVLRPLTPKQGFAGEYVDAPAAEAVDAMLAELRNLRK